VARLRLGLDVRDVHGQSVSDPAVQVRLGPPDGIGTVSTTLALRGAPVTLEIADGPSAPALILRVTPSLYRDGAVTCTVNGSGTVTPMRLLQLPRRPSHWQPVFTAWNALDESFAGLRFALGGSPAFRVGQFSAPVTCVGAEFDAIDAADESRALAKLSLLNLYARLRDERAPGTGEPWFARVRELLLATRERFVAEVDEACWATVRDLAERDQGAYREANVKLHLDNFRAVPGVTGVGAAASVKTTERKANLQFSVARVTRDGRTAYLLDADIDENGALLLHTFDLIRHAFTGGTHPVDIHECLCVAFPETDLGYRLSPMALLPVPRARVRRAAATTARAGRHVVVPPAASARKRMAARKR
jgi:hypothetical protein